MPEIVVFWGRCALIGWDFASGIFGIIEVLCVLYTFYILSGKKGKADRKKWEDWRVRWAVYICAGAFVFSTFLLAPFLQYKSQKAKLAALEKEYDLAAGITHVNVSRPIATHGVEFLNKTLLVFVIEVVNLGKETVAHKWQCSVSIPGESSPRSTEPIFVNKRLPLDSPTGLRTFEPQDDLMVKRALSPLARGERIVGMAAFILNGIDMGHFLQTNATWKVSFSDGRGTNWICTGIATTDGAKSMPFFPIPGLTQPVLESPP